jgi:hypothetical protein
MSAHDEPRAQPSACLPASKPPGGGRQAPGSGACHTSALRVGAVLPGDPGYHDDYQLAGPRLSADADVNPVPAKIA